MTYSLGSGGATRPKAFGSWRVTQGIWVLTQDLWELGPYAGHKVLGQVGLQDPRDLGLRSCHTQATWVRRPFPTPSFLGIDGDPWPKLIIIIIIIIILVVVVVAAATVIDFSLQINFMFFFPIVMIFISNLIILMNIIIFIIIILNSSDSSSYSF